MPRQLNQDFFSDPGREKPKTSTLSSKVDPRVQELSQEIHSLKLQMRELERRSKETEGHIKRVEMSTVQGFERMRSICQRMDKYVKNSLQEVSSKFSGLAGRLTERKAMEAKVEELIDRQSQVVQRYETKMNQMQKVISEQELKLVNYNSAIKELMKSRHKL